MCCLRLLANVDAFPLCIKSKDVDEIVNTIYLISGSFGGVNLEDIAALPDALKLSKRLKEKCDIPIFHDDQHGTAVITLAGLNNALKVVGKELTGVRIAVNGAGCGCRFPLPGCCCPPGSGTLPSAIEAALFTRAARKG